MGSGIWFFHCQVGLNWVEDQVALEQEEILSLETKTLFKAKLSLPTSLQFGMSSSWWWSLSSAVSPSRGCCIGDTSLLQGLHLLGAYSISGVMTSRFVLPAYQSFVYTDSHNVWGLRDFLSIVVAQNALSKPPWLTFFVHLCSRQYESWSSSYLCMNKLPALVVKKWNVYKTLFLKEVTWYGITTLCPRDTVWPHHVSRQCVFTGMPALATDHAVAPGSADLCHYFTL